MNALERKQAIAEARARVEKIARAHIRIGRRRGATRVEQLRAETAKNLLWIAEKRASTFPVSELEELKKRFLKQSKKHERRIAWKTFVQVIKGNRNFTRGPVKEALDAAMAFADTAEEEGLAWMDMHSLNAWLAALDEFAIWHKPIGALMKPEVGEREH